MIFDVAKSECGWEITYDGIFAPIGETKVFLTEGEARAACEREAAKWRDWENRRIVPPPAP